MNYSNPIGASCIPFESPWGPFESIAQLISDLSRLIALHYQHLTSTFVNYFHCFTVLGMETYNELHIFLSSQTPAFRNS